MMSYLIERVGVAIRSICQDLVSPFKFSHGANDVELEQSTATMLLTVLGVEFAAFHYIFD